MENGRTPVNKKYIDVICTKLDVNVEDYMDEEASVFDSRVKGNFSTYTVNTSCGNECSYIAMELMRSSINRESLRYDELKQELDKVRAERDQLKDELHALKLNLALRGIQL